MITTAAHIAEVLMPVMGVLFLFAVARQVGAPRWMTGLIGGALGIPIVDIGEWGWAGFGIQDHNECTLLSFGSLVLVGGILLFVKKKWPHLQP